MKSNITICCLGCFWFIACDGLTKNPGKAIIPGTYTRASVHEFGKEYDTLVISNNHGQFEILRKWRYERVLDGLAQEPEYKETITTATYNSKSNTLNETSSGNRIVFDPEGRYLTIGTINYKRFKQ